MKALTVKQPCWRTNFRGRVFIHSGLKSAGNDIPTLLTKDQYWSLPFRNSWHENICDENFPFGSIIGSVEIVDCVINHPSVWAERSELFSNICKQNNCHEFIDWQIEGGNCESCKLVGQSYNVDQLPVNCFFKSEMPKPIYNCVLANPVMFDEPIQNVKGKLSFWEYELPAEFGHYEFLHPLNHG